MCSRKARQRSFDQSIAREDHHQPPAPLLLYPSRPGLIASMTGFAGRNMPDDRSSRLVEGENSESLEARHTDTLKDILMITATRCSWAPGVVLIVTSFGAAGEPPEIADQP